MVGFCLVFLAMSLTGTMYTMHPSGGGVVECKLWRYYIIEIRQSLNSSAGALGPTTGSFSAVAVTAFQHVLCSAVGGVGMLCVGWVIRKVRNR
jgi:hypothetical protein